MEIELGKLLRAIRRYWWYALVAAIVLGLISGGFGVVLPKSYTATTRVLINPEGVSGPTILGGNPNILIDVATSSPILNQVIEELELDVTDAQLRNDVLAVQQTGTSMILISVTNQDPQIAADISNTISEKLETRATELTMVVLQSKLSELEFQSSSLNDQIATLDARVSILSESKESGDAQVQAEIADLREDRLALAQAEADVNSLLRDTRNQLSQTYSVVSIVQPAEVPEFPNGLSPIILGILGAFVGAVFGAALVLLRAVRDNSIVSSSQVETVTGAPVLLHLPSPSTAQDFSIVKALLNGLSDSQQGRAPWAMVAAPTALETAEIQWLDSGSISELPIANGVVGDEVALAAALKAPSVILATQIGRTIESDLRITMRILHAAGVSIVGSLVIDEQI